MLRVVPAIEHDLAIDDYIGNADGILMRVFVRRLVCHRSLIEDRHVRPISLL